MSKVSKKAATTLVETMKRIYEKGLTTMTGGNLSIKEPDGVWVTPASIDKSTLREEDMLFIKQDGTIEGNHRVTSEFPAHRAILESNVGYFNAVLHTHMPTMVAYGGAHCIPNLHVLRKAYQKLGNKVGLAKYGLGGSEALAQNTAAALTYPNRASVLENHAIFTAGKCMKDAYEALEIMDLVARVEGNGAILSDSAISLLNKEQRKAIDAYNAPAHDVNNELLEDEESAGVSDQIVLLMKRLYQRNIITGTIGTISTCLDDGRVLITPDGIDVVDLQPQDIVIMKDGLRSGNGLPSDDYLLHQCIYKHNPKTKSVITASPKYIMAYGINDEPFASNVIGEAYYFISNVLKHEFGIGEEYWDFVAQKFDLLHQTAIIKNDCFIVLGKSLLNAYDIIEVSESTAKGLVLTARTIKPVGLDKNSVDYYNEKMMKKYG
jgi:L-fuculose-phosphate aldolase